MKSFSMSNLNFSDKISFGANFHWMQKRVDTNLNTECNSLTSFPDISLEGTSASCFDSIILLNFEFQRSELNDYTRAAKNTTELDQ